MPESDWTEEFGKYHISRPFGKYFQAIEINEDDVDSELLAECVENFVVAEVAAGYIIAPENIEQHLEVIKDHGMEAYLKERLRRVQDE
jgi:hypothetical protein